MSKLGVLKMNGIDTIRYRNQLCSGCKQTKSENILVILDFELQAEPKKQKTVGTAVLQKRRPCYYMATAIAK